MNEWLSHWAHNLRLLWLVSKGWNSTEEHKFFTISYRFFEKIRLVFTKMYDMRMKQH